MATIGDNIDKLNSLREQKRAYEEHIKIVSQQMADLESEIIDQLDKQKLTKSSGTSATVSISESVKPSVEDWDAFYAYIHRYRYYHLLERRPSVTGCRELLETKGKIPGIVPFTQRKLNLRSI